MDAISKNSIDNQFLALMEKRYLKARKHQVSEDLIKFNQLSQSLEYCKLCAQGKDALKDKFSQQVICEPSYKNISFCLITNQQHRTQTIVIVGSKWSTVLELQGLSKRKQNLPEYYQLIQIAKHIRRTIQKGFQKGFKIQLVGFCIGGSIALHVALLLHEKGINVSNTITFASPRILKEEYINQFKSSEIPVLQVVHGKDQFPLLFQSYYGYGSLLVLLKGAHYCWVENPTEKEISLSIDASELEVDAIEYHTKKYYQDSITEKIGLSVEVQYHLKDHYL